MKTASFNRKGKKVNVFIPEKEQDLSDDINPAFAFSGMFTELLVSFAKGKFDTDHYIRVELANRGLNINGQWIGFEAAKAEFKL